MAKEKSDIEKLRELIKGIRIAMLTTVDEDGSLRSRPMGTQQAEFDGDLWFFTAHSSPKVNEVEREHQVNVSYSDPDSQRYVSVSGTARVVRDRAKAEELWNPFLKTWFPKGLDDPELALLKIEVQKAEYWDSPSSAMIHLVGIVKATLTGKRPDLGENEKLDLSNASGSTQQPELTANRR
ncbi:MAG TPA: pyridoxamine 5'-phosphate oxidase family protein [Thermoanaerobaculia bacterium]|jgi:general stress protein 26|nr:pyridoxamine 5'-phosphate oxidase family protein [Thermoanaerobaculia bacterium]